MLVELRINSHELEKKISKMQSCTAELNAILPREIGQRNKLQSVDKLNEVNQALEQLIERYKISLEENISSTKQSVNELIEIDEEISRSLKP